MLINLFTQKESSNLPVHIPITIIKPKYVPCGRLYGAYTLRGYLTYRNIMCGMLCRLLKFGCIFGRILRLLRILLLYMCFCFLRNFMHVYLLKLRSLSYTLKLLSVTHVLKNGRLATQAAHWALRVTFPFRFMPNRLKNRISDFLRLDSLNDCLDAWAAVWALCVTLPPRFKPNRLKKSDIRFSPPRPPK